MSVEPVIAPSARKHGISDEDIRHAFANPVRVFELDDGFVMLIGANTAAVLLESVSSRPRRVWLSYMPCVPARSS